MGYNIKLKPRKFNFNHWTRFNVWLFGECIFLWIFLICFNESSNVILLLLANELELLIRLLSNDSYVEGSLLYVIVRLSLKHNYSCYLHIFLTRKINYNRLLRMMYENIVEVILIVLIRVMIWDCFIFNFSQHFSWWNLYGYCIRKQSQSDHCRYGYIF